MKPIRDQWNEYASMVYPVGAPDFQLRELEQAFFAGALSLWTAIMKGLDPEAEPTADDMQRMADIETELIEYAITIEASGFGGFRH